MANSDVFRFLDLPPEIRQQIYRYLKITGDSPLSIYSLAYPPKVINKLRGPVRDDMRDAYCGLNRFTISSHIGLPELLTSVGPKTVSKLRRLRLEHHPYAVDDFCAFGPHSRSGTRPRNGPLLSDQTHHVQYQVTADITVLRTHPFFNLLVTSISESYETIQQLHKSMDTVLSIIFSAKREGHFTLSVTMIDLLVQHWSHSCQKLLRLGPDKAEMIIWNTWATHFSNG